MNKDEWYQDRILWRANQNNLLDKSCMLFSEMAEDNRKLIIDTIKDDINPVLVFWEGSEKWTTLGTRAISSCHHGTLNTVDLDEIKKKIVVQSPADSEKANIKTDANLLLLEETGKRVWAPQGAELFALMNILLMFPLKEKK